MKDLLQAEHCAEMLAALAAPERLRMIRFLREGPRNVTEIAALLQSPPVNAAHHLSKLHAAGLIQRCKQGRFVLYSLTPDVLHATNASTYHLDLGCCRLELPAPEPSRLAGDLAGNCSCD
jgi:DNA-binding transcriptional ArsR family regulator